MRCSRGEANGGPCGYAGAAASLRDAATGLLADGSAIIETAEVVGITDPVGMDIPVEARGTRGMGEAISPVAGRRCAAFFCGAWREQYQ